MSNEIKVVGIGGVGNIIVNKLIDDDFKNIDFIVIDDIYRYYNDEIKATKFDIGKNLSHGLDGGTPERYEKAAIDNREEIAEFLKGSKIVIMIAGIGGGVGTGVSTIVADITRELDIFTVAVVTLPFTFEGPLRNKRAKITFENLQRSVDIKIVIKYDATLKLYDPKTPMTKVFQCADEQIYKVIVNILESIKNFKFIKEQFDTLKSLDFIEVSETKSKVKVKSFQEGKADYEINQKNTLDDFDFSQGTCGFSKDGLYYLDCFLGLRKVKNNYRSFNYEYTRQ